MLDIYLEKFFYCGFDLLNSWIAKFNHFTGVYIDQMVVVIALCVFIAGAAIAEIMTYVTNAFTLLPGDVILTGTPAGLGGFIDGQTVDITISGIGTLSNPARNRDDRP